MLSSVPHPLPLPSQRHLNRLGPTAPPSRPASCRVGLGPGSPGRAGGWSVCPPASWHRWDLPFFPVAAGRKLSTLPSSSGVCFRVAFPQEPLLQGREALPALPQSGAGSARPGRESLSPRFFAFS